MNSDINTHAKNDSLNFNSVFNQSWSLFTKSLGMGILAIVIYLIASGMVGFMIESITGFNSITQEFMEDIQGMNDPNTLIYKMQDFYMNNLSLIVISRLLTEFILILTFPLAAGFIMVCREIDQRGYSEVKTLFIGFKPEYWGRLMVLAIVYFILSKIAIMLFILPGVYLWVAACIACPFVLFKGMSGMEALKASIHTVNQKWFSVFKILVVASLIGISGYLLCGVGRVATYPFVLVTIYMLYKNMVGFDDDEITEIGKN